MKKLLLALLLAGAAISPSYAQLVPPASASASTPKQAEPNEADLQTHGHYKNKAGQEVHAPAKSVNGKVPDGASAKCRDASYSFSKNHRGTCSHHGGVASWL
jgi:uncharacterized protein (DUF1800 family)